MDILYAIIIFCFTVVLVIFTLLLVIGSIILLNKMYLKFKKYGIENLSIFD